MAGKLQERPACQQQSVLGDPLNRLEQVVLEGQISAARAHLKGKAANVNPRVFLGGKDPDSSAQEDKLYFFGVFFRATPAAYGSSQARG